MLSAIIPIPSGTLLLHLLRRCHGGRRLFSGPLLSGDGPKNLQEFEAAEIAFPRRMIPSALTDRNLPRQSHFLPARIRVLGNREMRFRRSS